MILAWLLACAPDEATPEPPEPVELPDTLTASELQAMLGCADDNACEEAWPGAIAAVEALEPDHVAYVGRVFLEVDDPEVIAADPYVAAALAAALEGMQGDLRQLAHLTGARAGTRRELGDVVEDAIAYFADGQTASDGEDVSDLSFLGTRGATRIAARAVADDVRSSGAEGEEVLDATDEAIEGLYTNVEAEQENGVMALVEEGLACLELLLDDACSADGKAVLSCGTSGVEAEVCDDDGTEQVEFCLPDEARCTGSDYYHDGDGSPAGDDCDDADAENTPQPASAVAWDECLGQRDYDCSGDWKPLETCMCTFGTRAPTMGTPLYDGVLSGIIDGPADTDTLVVSVRAYGEDAKTCGTAIDGAVHTVEVVYPTAYDPDAVEAPLTFEWRVLSGPLSILHDGDREATVTMYIPSAPTCLQTDLTVATAEVTAVDCSGMQTVRTLQFVSYNTPVYGPPPGG